MRYDKKVLFQRVTDVYQPNGDYVSGIAEEVTDYASIVNTDFDTMRLVYGEIKQGSITLHLLNKIAFVFNQVVIDGKTYSVDQVVDQRTKQAYILSEVQGGN